MRKINVFKYLFLLALPVFMVSCEEENVENIEPKVVKSDSSTFTSGAFILNEGGFTAANASLTFINSKDSIIDDAFSKINSPIILGSILQSAAIKDSLLFMVMNVSGKVVVSNANTLKQVQQIDGLAQPRYIALANGKAYISQWGTTAGEVKVVSLETFKVIKTISVGTGPEGIVISGNKAWVANSGGFSSDSAISVIDIATDELIKTIKVADCPRELTVDKDGNIWAVCSGTSIYDYNPPYALIKESASALVKINPSDYSVSTTTIAAHDHPSHIDISADKSKVYYGCNGNDGIYEVSVSNPSIPTRPIVAGWFYGFNVNPRTGEIFVCDANDYKTAGEVTKYSSTGTKIKSYTSGLIPNGVLFTK